MKIEEVIPPARDEGKKIRRRKWAAGCYLSAHMGSGPGWPFYDENGHGYLFLAEDIAATDWEVVNECPHTKGSPAWAAWMFERGKVLTYGDGREKYRQPRNMPIEVHVGGDLWSTAYLYPEMLAATDWREVPDE